MPALLLLLFLLTRCRCRLQQGSQRGPPSRSGSSRQAASLAGDAAAQGGGVAGGGAALGGRLAPAQELHNQPDVPKEAGNVAEACRGGTETNGWEWGQEGVIGTQARQGV